MEAMVRWSIAHDRQYKMLDADADAVGEDHLDFRHDTRRRPICFFAIAKESFYRFIMRKFYLARFFRHANLNCTKRGLPWIIQLF